MTHLVCNQSCDQTDTKFQNKCLWRIHNINRIQQISNRHTNCSADSAIHTAEKQCTKYTYRITQMEGCCISPRKCYLDL